MAACGEIPLPQIWGVAEVCEFSTVYEEAVSPWILSSALIAMNY
jgi:hypothetical protein